MLVLSRKKDESIYITIPTGEIITLTVVEIRGDKVRLGINADASVTIDREEVYHAKLRNPEGKPNTDGSHQKAGSQRSEVQSGSDEQNTCRQSLQDRTQQNKRQTISQQRKHYS